MSKLQRLCLVLCLGCGALACGEEPPPAPPPKKEAKSEGAKKEGGAHGGKADAKEESRPASSGIVRVFKDSDFVESEQNRDPFRNFISEFRGKGPVVAQRTVLMPNTPIAEMRLIAIVSGIEQPRAMIVDNKGVGYVATRGDFVGRAEVVQSGGAENLPVTLNWRVDRIRENEVILAREDPTGPNRPPLTRIIPLHPKEELPGAVSEARNDEG